MKRLRAIVPIWRLERLWGRLVRLTWPKYRVMDERDNRYIEQILIHVLRRNSSCIDVGSHAGAVLRHFLRLAPQGRHFAFEPLPHLAEKLRQSFPTAEVFNVALCDTSGESPFVHVIGDPGWSGLKLTQSVSRRPIETIMVRTCLLDDVIPHDVKIDFIKIDVEGAELQVLKGACRTIQKWSPYIVFEHGLGAADQYGTAPNAGGPGDDGGEFFHALDRLEEQRRDAIAPQRAEDGSSTSPPTPRSGGLHCCFITWRAKGRSLP